MEAAASPRTILIVEDDGGLALLMQQTLESAHFSATVANCATTAVEHLGHHPADLLILDLTLPDMTGLELLETLARQNRALPFIVVTGRNDAESAITMMKRGALDYLIKDASLPDLLPAVVGRAFEQVDRDLRLAEAEARVHDQGRLLETVLDALPHPLYIIDTESNAVVMGNRAARQCNRTAFLLHLAGQAEKAADCPIQEVKRTGRPLQLEHVEYVRTEQARVHEIHVYPVSDGAGEVRQVIEYDVDVTTRKRAERALRESEARLRQVVESLPLVLLSRDINPRRYSLIIGAVHEVLGYDPQQFLDNPDFMLNILHPEDVTPVRAFIRESVMAQRPFEVDCRIRHGVDGRTVWLRAQGVPICDEEGNLLRIDCLLIDITREKEIARDREQMEARLQQAQRLESLGVLAGGIAHDFGNLLTIINGNVQFLRESLSPGPAEAKALADIEVTARNASDMTRSLQAFSKPTKPQIVQVDANSLIQEVYRFLGRLMPVRIDFRFVPAPSLCRVAADPAQIQQVLINLCINARDAMSGQGQLEIRTRQVTANQLPSKLRFEAASRNYVEICVSDTGCGMDDQTMRRAFDPFFTTKPKDQGTGLGLATAYKIIRAHGGMIDVVSTPGVGSEFRVYLPQAEEASSGEPARDQPPRGIERILVVDDERMIASLIRTLLEAKGYKVTVAHRPEDAISLARNAVSPVDLVIMDYGLPGMGGDQCLLRLRESWPGLKAILISGRPIAPAELGLPDVRVLQKPFSAQAITHAVRETLDGSS